jgi:hypothetical protein
MDTDTVIVNDRVDELIEESEDQFLICRHWWVPTLRDYLSRVRVATGLVSHLIDENNLDIPYFASGLFLFQKDKHDHIFDTFHTKFDSVFGSIPNNAEGITDELLLCLTLNETGGFKTTNGSMNHSSEREQMPLVFNSNDKKFYGKNPQDDIFKKVFAFHNDLLEFYTLSYFRTAFDDEDFIKNFKEVCYAEE